MHERHYLPGLTALGEPKVPHAIRLRDVVAVSCRHRLLLSLSFCGILLVSVLATWLLPNQYEAHLKILVKNARVDPIVSAEPNAPPPASSEVSEEQALNSEAELLKTRDLLERVVVATGLDRGSRALSQREANDKTRLAIAIATRKLAHDLRVAPISKTNIIEVSYRSSEPKLAAEVLNTLARFYLQSHIELHSTPGQYTFFSHLAEDYQKQLLEAEAKLAGAEHAAPPQLRDAMMQKYNDASASIAATKAAIVETDRRLAGLQRQYEVTPARIVTQAHSADNQMLLQQLKGTLLNLQLKRAELLTKYQPTYRLVQEVDRQINDAEAAISHEEISPAREQTTDQNPTRMWIGGEAAKARADLVSLKARQGATEDMVREYETRMKELEQDSIVYDDLQRAVNTAKENYALYVRKAEEARISEALDRNNILNVAIAENAAEPLLPAYSRYQYLLIGLFLALVGSVGFVFAAHRLDRCYHTPEEVTRSLQLPVLAAIPAEDAGIGGFFEAQVARCGARLRAENDGAQ